MTDDLRAKANAQIKLGIVADLYSQLPLEEAVRRIRADGFSNVLTNFAFADIRFDPWSPDWEAGKKITLLNGMAYVSQPCTVTTTLWIGPRGGYAAKRG